MPETWKPVVGFEDYYEVSDLGNVRSLPRLTRLNRNPYRTKGKVLAVFYRDNPRYASTNLCVESVHFNAYMHTMVLEAFVGPRPKGLQARHLDGDIRNNSVSNLRWGTPTENMADMDRHGTRCRGKTRPNAKLTETDIPAIRAAKAAGEKYRALAARYGVAPSAIYQVIVGRTWTHV